MTIIREQFIAQKFNEWLDRFSPPRRIANDQAAQQADANAMMVTVLGYAPRDEYSEWLVAMLRRLEDGMTTRSWPAPGEVVKACKGGDASGHGGISEQAREESVIDRLTAWHAKFGTQMPSHGNDKRTRVLIDRGVLADLREARFKGFDLSFDDNLQAKGMKMGKSEWKHHIGVMAKLRGISDAEAEMQVRAEARQPTPPADFQPKTFGEYE